MIWLIINIILTPVALIMIYLLITSIAFWYFAHREKFSINVLRFLLKTKFYKEPDIFSIDYARQQNGFTSIFKIENSPIKIECVNCKGKSRY